MEARKVNKKTSLQEEKSSTPNLSPLPLLSWLGLPWLHVALPNQNIALHFWFPAKEPGGKVAQSLCVSPFRNECRARPERMWLSWMLLLWEHPCGCWLERRGWEERARERRMVPSALNKLPPHGAPACLMPGTDSGLARQIWKAVFTQGSV